MTEHISNSKIIFDTFDESECGVIKCAYKTHSAVLKTEEARTVKMKSQMAIYLKLTVILATALKENLLLLRKFPDIGLCICLDNKKIYIIGPLSNKIFCQAFHIVHID